MAFDNRELKKLSLTFRDVSSRALRSDENSARANLGRLLRFVAATPLLAAEVGRAPTDAEDISIAWQDAIQNGAPLPIPDEPLAELGQLNAVIHMLVESTEPMWRLCYNYNHVHSMKECVPDVLGDIVKRYVDHLNRVVEIELLDSQDAAYGPARRLEIHVAGSMNQLNVAQDGSEILATQTMSVEATAIVDAARALMRLAETEEAGRDHLATVEVQELAATVAAEMQRRSPARFTIRAAADKLEALSRCTTALGALADPIHQLWRLIQSWLLKG